MTTSNTTRERPEPECLEPEMLTFLDELRESGVTNMFGAGPYLEEEFQLSRKDAGDVLLYWMHTFEERHADDPPEMGGY